MEWSTDTKNGYGDLEVYMEYGYVFVSSTGRNHVKMAAFSFKCLIKCSSKVLTKAFILHLFLECITCTNLVPMENHKGHNEGTYDG